MTYFPPLVPYAAPLAVRTKDDARAQLPAWMKLGDAQPITEALLDALLAVALEAQHGGSYAAAQSHIARATGRYLAELAAERIVAAGDGESDEELRARVSQVQQTATLTALRAAVNAILVPHTSSRCQIIEPALDRWFVRGAAEAEWYGGCVGAGISPPYVDRLYPSDASRNDGVSLESSEPKGARVFSDRIGRLIAVIVPDLLGMSEIQALAWGGPRPKEGSSGDPRISGPASFAGGTVAQVQFFARSAGAVADAVMGAIEDAVNGLLGQSMRWVLLSDPRI